MKADKMLKLRKRNYSILMGYTPTPRVGTKNKNGLERKFFKFRGWFTLKGGLNSKGGISTFLYILIITVTLL